jgi:L,D-transpeptidase ErfK/SrfK
MLFHFSENEVSRHYPVAVGSRGWPTPVGEFQIVSMEVDPVWDVPASIQEEMRQQGKRVLTKVAPGPSNPLGKYWIGLSLPGIGVHGTNNPSSIYGFHTHGCIRLHNDDVRDLFARVNVGMDGSIIHEPVLMTTIGDSVFVEVHADTYKRGIDPLRYLQDLAFTRGLSGKLDWTIVKEVIRKHDGIARDVSRH